MRQYAKRLRFAQFFRVQNGDAGVLPAFEFVTPAFSGNMTMSLPHVCRR